MVTIRLSRGGAKKRPFYHIHVTDSRKRRDGRYIERIGYFNPIARGGEIRLNVQLDRVDYWLGHGAQTSDRVAQLVKQYRKETALNLAAEATDTEVAQENSATAD